MARKYSKGAEEKVGEVMHEFKEGKLKSSSGDKVTSRKQAIAIGLSEARDQGEKTPRKAVAAKPTTKKQAPKKGATPKKKDADASATSPFINRGAWAMG